MALRNERQKVQVRIAAAVRAAAVRRLMERHPLEFRRYYEEEAEKRGLTPAPHTGLVPKKSRIAGLIKEIKESGILDGVDVPEEPDRYAVPETPWIADQRMTRADQLNAAAAGVPHQEPPSSHPSIPPAPW